LKFKFCKNYSEFYAKKVGSGLGSGTIFPDLVPTWPKSSGFGSVLRKISWFKIFVLANFGEQFLSLQRSPLTLAELENNAMAIHNIKNYKLSVFGHVGPLAYEGCKAGGWHKTR
jgi:hypothetical protein